MEVDFHVALSDFVMLLSAMNVVYSSTPQRSLQTCSHQMAYVPKRMHCSVLISSHCYIELLAISCVPHVLTTNSESDEQYVAVKKKTKTNKGLRSKTGLKHLAGENSTMIVNLCFVCVVACARG